MVLFTIGAIPLTIMLLTTIFFPEQIFTLATWGYFLRGVLSFVPIAVLFYFIKIPDPPYLDGSMLYWHYLVYRFLIFHVGAIVFFLINFGFDFENRATERELLQPRMTMVLIMAFITGFYTFTGLIDVVEFFGWYDSYILFMLPVLRVAIVLCTTLLLYLMLSMFRLLKIPFLLGAGAVVMVTALVPFFYYRSFFVVSVLLTAILFVTKIGLLVFLRSTLGISRLSR
jgi:hypothetical protein